MGDWFDRTLGKLPFLTPGADANPTLRQGSKGAAVSRWQTLVGVKADGNFGPGTKAATVAFQKAHGLTPDGVVGPAAWAAAGAAGAPAAKTSGSKAAAPAKAPAKAPDGGSTPVLRQGMTDASTGGAVSRWQTIAGASPVDGKFGAGTVKATKAWQSAHGLKPDGTVGPASWNLAASSPQTTPETAVALPNASATAAPINIPTPTLRSGSNDAHTRGAVSRWQGILAAELDRGIVIDGVFGSTTVDQTKLLQKNWGIVPDGVVGPKTWATALSPHKPAPTGPNAGVTAAHLAPVTAHAVNSPPTVWTNPETEGATTALATTSHQASSPAWLWLPVLGVGGIILHQTLTKPVPKHA